MIDDRLLDHAVSTELITADQAQGLRRLAREMAEPEDPAYYGEEEALRFVSGFGDIFVTLGLGLFLGAAFLLAQLFVEMRWAFLDIALLSWLLAEFFTRRRRMALPSIVLLLAFASATLFGLIGIAVQITGAVAPRVDSSGLSGGLALGLAGIATLGLCWLHYRRFQVPITVAAGVGAAIIAGVALIGGLSTSFLEAYYLPIGFAAGLATFALAMRFDLSDKARLTHRAAIAFWLHLLAAPLIVHPLMTVAGVLEHGFVPQADGSDLTIAGALLLLAGFAFLSMVSILIDRRALLVSGLIYAGYAFWTLVSQAGLGGDEISLVTALLLGAFVLAISAGWRPIRRALVHRLPRHWQPLLPETADMG